MTLTAIKKRRNADASATGPLIEVKDLSVTFGGQTILKDINLTIERGQTVAIIGESGCGKTVCMKTLVGLIAPTIGTVKFAGKDLQRLNHAELTKVRRKFGFVFQNAALFDSMSIFDNIAFPMRQSDRIPESDVRKQVMKHLTEVGLPDNVAGKRRVKSPAECGNVSAWHEP